MTDREPASEAIRRWQKDLAEHRQIDGRCLFRPRHGQRRRQPLFVRRITRNFEGDFVKKPERLKKRIQEAVNRGTPKRNWDTNPDDSKRDGWICDWDFGQPNQVGRLSPWEVKGYGLPETRPPSQ